MHSPPLRTSLGRSSSSRRLAAGNDHDVQLLRTVPSPFWWLAAAVCLHLMAERWPERMDTVTVTLTAPAADRKSVPWRHQWRHHPGRPRRCPQKHTAGYSDYCQLICRLQQHGADRWDAVCTVTGLHMTQRCTHGIRLVRCTAAAAPTRDK